MDILLTPKFVLIDTLIDNNQMEEVDWKEEESEVRFAIERIGKAKKYNYQLSLEDKYDDSDTLEVINSINDYELHPSGYTLELLDIDSDSYVFTVAPFDKQQEVKTMFAKLK